MTETMCYTEEARDSLFNLMAILTSIKEAQVGLDLDLPISVENKRH